MKTLSALCLLLLGSLCTLQAQNDSGSMASVNNQEKETIKVTASHPANTPARFKGGQKALHEYLSDAFVYTNTDRENGFEGTIIVRCVIGTTGLTEKAWIVQSVHSTIDERAKAVVLEMPKWEPAMNNGVRTSTTIDIPFELKLR